MSLTVKAFYKKDGVDVEIRRFNIPSDVSSSFDYLEKKVATMFPLLREGKFSLYWRDSEGDLVQFSTDEELLEALGYVEDSLFKIFITAKEGQEPVDGSSSAPQQASHGKVHQGVICDGCNGQVKGARYKCLECPDFDLCGRCEEKVHHEHDMMKITKPSRAPFYLSALPSHRGHGMMRHGHPRFPGPGGQGEFAPPPHFRRWMRRFMRRWHSHNGTGCPMEQDSPDDELSPPEGPPFAFPTTSPRNQPPTCGKRGQRGRSAPGRCHSSPKVSPRCPETAPMKEEKTHKNIDVIIDLTSGADQTVGMETERTADGQTGTAEERATEEITNATEKIVLDDDAGERVASEFNEGRQPPEPAKMDVQHGNRDKSQQEEDWTVLNVSQKGAQTTAGETPSSEPSPASPVQAAPVQAPVDQPAPPATVASTGRTPTVQFQIPPQIFYPPSNPRVAESLQQMLAMGFNNDGGWLTGLLEDKQGNIIEVLDAIKPQPGRVRESNGGYMA